MFFLKKDVYYLWMREVGLNMMRNTSHFRKTWLREKIAFDGFEGRYFCSFLFIQKKFSAFIDQISDHVINLVARKIVILNREVTASREFQGSTPVSRA